MTGFSPRQPTTAAPARPSATSGADGAPDPWGVRKAENLLTSLEGILSARVVTTPLGEVSEVHILAQAGLQPKQLVRRPVPLPGRPPARGAQATTLRPAALAR